MKGKCKEKMKIPEHIGIIMDGNGRWAEKRKMPRSYGHKKGADALKKCVEACLEMGVSCLTVYAFSTENWKRSFSEIEFLSKLLVEHVVGDLDYLMENGVRVRISGDYLQFPAYVHAPVETALETTAVNRKMILNIALNYGGRREILEAVRAIVREDREKKMDIEGFTEEDFSGYLQTAGLPDPEIIIRTSGEQRLSNFLLWQCAYSEMVFPDVLWPDFTGDDLKEAVAVFNARKRRFGGV